jgi:hypothetical protein
MTAQRQERYGFGRLVAFFALLAGSYVACRNPAALTSTTERMVVNRFSGLAIERFDPVGYFVKKQPVLGLPVYEAS